MNCLPATRAWEIFNRLVGHVNHVVNSSYIGSICARNARTKLEFIDLNKTAIIFRPTIIMSGTVVKCVLLFQIERTADSWISQRAFIQVLLNRAACNLYSEWAKENKCQVTIALNCYLSIFSFSSKSCNENSLKLFVHCWESTGKFSSWKWNLYSTLLQLHFQ